MSDLQKINQGTAPSGTDGDTVRVGFSKVNANTDVLRAQVALVSGAVITQPQALTSAHIGKRVSINLSSSGTVNMPAANTCPPDGVIALRNVGTAAVSLAVGSGSGDTFPLSKLYPGEATLVDTDGLNTWGVLLRGRASGDDETVHGALTVSGGGSFGVRPTFGGKTPWDTANLPAPLDTSSLSSARGTLAVGMVLLGSVTCTGGNIPAFTGLFSDEFAHYEIVWNGVTHPSSVSGGSDQLVSRVHIAGMWDAGSNYTWGWTYLNVSTLASPPITSAQDTRILLYNGQSGPAPLGSSGKFRLYRPTGLSGYRQISWESIGHNPVGFAYYLGAGAYVGGVGIPVDGIQFTRGDGGAPLSGTFRLYGVRA